MNRLKNVVLLFSILAILTMASSTQLCANNVYLPFATSIDTSYKPGNFEDFEPELDGDWQEFYNLLSSEKLDLNYDQLCARGEIKILDGYKV
ncbi:hypothetical protein EOM81_13400, partial [bacterium]|nr:hypothetical protein [bacterium]